GAWAALERGLIQKKVAAVREQRLAAVAHRKDALTGTSDYPDLRETIARVLDMPRVVTPQEADAKPSIEPLPSIRLAEPFEQLRDASDAMLKKTGTRPRVFLATLGTPSDFTARATFARNFYEAGGIEAVSAEPSAASLPPPERRRSAREASRVGVKNSKDDPSPPLRGDPPLSGEGSNMAALLAAYKESGARLACLCSSDKIYQAQAAAAAKALTDAGAIVHLAGRPGAHEAEWR